MIKVGQIYKYRTQLSSRPIKKINVYYIITEDIGYNTYFVIYSDEVDVKYPRHSDFIDIESLITDESDLKIKEFKLKLIK